MIAAWVAYGLVVSALLHLAALVAERSARWSGLPMRWIWAGTIGLGGALPWLAARSAATPIPAAVTTPGEPGPAVDPGAASLWAAWISRLDRVAESVGVAWTRVVGTASAVDLPLLVLWTAATAVLLSVLVITYRRLSLAASGWPVRHMHGHRVRVSEDLGPAVLGVARGQVVLPRWAAQCPPDHRRLIVLHEVEHLRAGDERLLLTAVVVVMLMPWNVFAWWQLRRLRLAVELDCDQRVLGTGVQVRQYASLLLDAGSLRGAAPLTAAAFVHFHSQLGRRIREMTEMRKGPRYVPAALGTVAALGLLVAACETPAPTDPAMVQELTEGKQLSHVSPADAGDLYRVLEDGDAVALVVEEADGDTYIVDKAQLEEIRRNGYAGAVIEKLRQHGEPATLKLTLVHEDGTESAAFGLRTEATDPEHNVKVKLLPTEEDNYFTTRDASTLRPAAEAEAWQLKRQQAAEREMKRTKEGGTR